ncbi:hypothetical protein, partial [Bacillus toyonensis]|uniref:hypothetical protein n=1 Tax=Bacillus toyonensis TaxID=155322 RepID=UPI003CE7EFB0
MNSSVALARRNVVLSAGASGFGGIVQSFVEEPPSCSEAHAQGQREALSTKPCQLLSPLISSNASLLRRSAN